MPRQSMRQQVRLGLEQRLDDLHVALYESYAHAHRDAPRHRSYSGARAARRGVPALRFGQMRGSWRDIASKDPDRALQVTIGTALWNLIDVYERKDPPRRFTELLADVLDVDVARARELRRSSAYNVFPPVSGRLIRDSSFSVPEKASPGKSGGQVTVTVTLDRDFHELREVVLDPERWPERFSLFWRGDMNRRDDGWEGNLTLPGKHRIAVVLKEVNVPPVDPTETQTVFTIAQNAYITGGLLSFRLIAAPSRPGWTHVIHDRTITFSDSLGEPELPTLSYWTKSDIACLALG
jgi:hypothetical protein